jgi:hypothetical protein
MTTKLEFTVSPEVIDYLWRTTADYKAFAREIADVTSSGTKLKISDQWADALTNFIDEIGGDGPSLWQWKGITPTPEKIVEYLREYIQYLEQSAADGELNACCNVMEINGAYVSGNVLRAIRRPKSPTLDELALQFLGTIEKDGRYLPEITDTIRKALTANLNSPESQ